MIYKNGKTLGRAKMSISWKIFSREAGKTQRGLLSPFPLSRGIFALFTSSNFQLVIQIKCIARKSNRLIKCPFCKSQDHTCNLIQMIHSPTYSESNRRCRTKYFYLRLQIPHNLFWNVIFNIVNIFSVSENSIMLIFRFTCSCCMLLELQNVTDWRGFLLLQVICFFSDVASADEFKVKRRNSSKLNPASAEESS